jgi:hypothetical protein
MTEPKCGDSTISLSQQQAAALLSLLEELSENQDDATESFIGKSTYCCRYWVGERDKASNNYRRKINIRTQTQLQADAICILRRTRDFGTASGGATVSEGACNADDWPPS